MDTSIEHRPWICDEKYSLGIEGQRIAIVGHSHWRDQEESDSDNFTITTISAVIGGKALPFFPHVRGYFGWATNDFWNHVMFFNYLPECLTKDQRYGDGTTEQLQRAAERFQELIARERPHKVLVFTKKGWPRFPLQPDHLEHLGSGFPPYFTWGLYGTEGWSAMVFGLRHPQGAPSKLMKEAVRAILQKPLVWSDSN